MFDYITKFLSQYRNFMFMIEWGGGGAGEERQCMMTNTTGRGH